MATKIGINDISTELAMMICNRFKLEKSVYHIDKTVLAVPIGVEFNKKLDTLIVIKNSTVLSSTDYEIDDEGINITPVDTKAWDASKQYPVEFNFIVLKSVVPGVNASLWRGTHTITSETKAVPITVRGFNPKTDDIIVIKNSVVVAHDEYEIVDNTIVAAGPNGKWEASKKSPVKFDYMVFKFATPSNAMAINGYHLLNGSVELDALHPDLKNLLSMTSIYMKKIDFLFEAISKYGNTELINYIKENYNDEQSEVMQRIDESNKAYTKLLNLYSEIATTSDARYEGVLREIEKLKLVKKLEDEINGTI